MDPKMNLAAWLGITKRAWQKEKERPRANELKHWISAATIFRAHWGGGDARVKALLSLS